MIQLYWRNATDKIVGDAHGVSQGDLDELKPRMCQAHQAVKAQISAGQLGYAALPAHTSYAAQPKALVDKYRSTARPSGLRKKQGRRICAGLVE